MDRPPKRQKTEEIIPPTKPIIFHTTHKKEKIIIKPSSWITHKPV